MTCPNPTTIDGTGPICSDIQNRTGHTVNVTATLTDKATGGVVASSGGPIQISGSPGSEIRGTVNVYLPPTTQLLPTFILDVKVVDTVTGWSTERQAYVTATSAGIGTPLF